MSSETLFESEEDTTGPETARVLRALATGLADGTRFQLGAGSDAIAVTAPDTLELEIELERETTDTDLDGLELELELEWHADADTAIRFGESEPEGNADLTTEPVLDRQEETVDPTGTDEDSADPVSEGSGLDTAVDSPTDADPPIPVQAAAASKARFELYQDRRDRWRWRLCHQNGNIIATGAQGYASRRNAKRGLESVKVNAFAAPVDISDRNGADSSTAVDESTDG